MAVSKPRLPILNPSHPLARGLVGAWLHYEGSGATVQDKSVFRAHGAVTGASWVQTKRGWALNFTASSGTYVSVSAPDLASLDSAFTFFVLFRMDVLRNYNTIIHKGPTNVPRPFDAYVRSDASSRYIYGDGSATVTHSLGGWLAGQWYTAAGMWDGATVKSYRDAVEFASTASTAPGDASDNLLWGKRTDGGTLLDGQVAAVLVYNRALPATQIRALHVNLYQGYRQYIAYGPLLTAATTTSTVRLEWQDNSSTETLFSIERSTTSATSGFSEIDTVAADTTQYDDTGLAANTYWYRVRAYDGSVYSDYSNVVEITVS